MIKNKTKKNLTSCSFCGKSEDEVDKIVAASDAAICDKCIKICEEVLIEEEQENEISDDIISIIENNLLKPKEICKILNEYVIGQDEAKKIISVGVFNLYRQLINTYINSARQV